MDLEIKIIVKVASTDTLADVRRKLSDPNGVFTVNNALASTRTECTVTCHEIVEANSRLEWVSEKSASSDIIANLDDTPPQEFDYGDHEKDHRSATTVEETQDSTQGSVEFNLPHLRRNFTYACVKFEELVSKNPHHIGQFVVVFHRTDGTLDHKFLDVTKFEEAFAVIRKDTAIDKSKAPFVVVLDTQTVMSSHSSHDNLLRNFNQDRYFKNVEHQKSFVLYRSAYDTAQITQPISDLAIDTGSATTHLFSMNHINTSTLKESIFALDYITTISGQYTPILLIDGIDLSLEDCGEWVRDQVVSVALDVDLFFYLVTDSSRLDEVTSKRIGGEKVNNLLVFGSQVQSVQSISLEERASLLEALQKFGIFPNLNVGSLKGVVGKTLMDAYVFYTNGNEHGGIRFANKSCRIRCFDSKGHDITKARFDSNPSLLQKKI